MAAFQRTESVLYPGKSPIKAVKGREEGRKENKFL